MPPLGKVVRSGRTCGNEGCKGPLGPVLVPPVFPDVWVRLDARGAWRGSPEPPAWPQEVAAPFGYRCFGCGNTFRVAVERAQPISLRNAF